MRVKIVVFLFLISFSNWSQTIVFSENMGSPTGTTSIAANAFQNASPIIFSGTADVRTTSSSSTYTGSSGTGNVFFTSTTKSFFEISGINTSSYTNLILSFGHYKGAIAASNELIVEVSSDGIAYTSLNYTRTTGSGTTGWVLITPSGSIPSTSNLRIRFSQLATTTEFFRIDDVILKGNPLCTVTSTWNGSTWSSGVPTSTTSAIINGNYSTNSSGSINACSLSVNSPATLSVTDSQYVKLEYNLTVASGATVTFENNSSLIQVNSDAINSGNITYKRNTNPIDKFDYTYWSTPVKNQRLIDVSPTTSGDKFLSFNSSINDWYYETNTNVMTAGKGYIIRGPQEYYSPTPPSIYVASFIGEPISGNVSIPIVGTGVSNLLGNPYPSALNANTFLTANNSVIDGTIYFWTHNTDIGTNVSNPGSGTYAYSSDDYASYNLTGGTGTQAVSGGSVPNGEIAAGQSFFTTSVASGNAVFTNAMRLKSGAVIDNSLFFKQSNSNKTAEVEQNRLWLNLMNDEGAFKQTLIGYVTGATNDYESAYDGVSFNANTFVNFYSIQNDLGLAIQGRALPFEKSDVVTLGYESAIDAEFKIAIDQTDGFFDDMPVYLEDKLLNILHDLKESPYSFTTVSGVFDDRFVLRYTSNNNTLSTDDFDALSNTVFVATKNKEISITASTELIDKIYVYDFSGRRLYSETAIDSNLVVVKNLANANVALVVKVILNNGKTITRKIAY